MSRPIRFLIAAAVAALSLMPAAALADEIVPPHVTLQSGPEACQLQAVLENFPAGIVDLTFTSPDDEASFPVEFTGEEGGSDLLVTAGPFGPGVWRARVGDVASEGVEVPADCAPETPGGGGATPTTTTPALGGGPSGAAALPFTGAGHVLPMLAAGLGALLLGGASLWRARAGKARA